VFNVHDPIVSVGHGLLSFTTAAGGDGGCHAGHPIPMRNDALTTANPYTNHLRYVLDSFELFPANPCARVRYALPGIVYTPDADGRAIAQPPRHHAPRALPVPPPASALPPEPGHTRANAVVAPVDEPAGCISADRPATGAASLRGVAGAGSLFSDSSSLTAEAERLSAEAVASLAWTAQRARSLLLWGDGLEVQVNEGALHEGSRRTPPADGPTPPAEDQAPPGAVVLRGDEGVAGPDHSAGSAAAAAESTPTATEAVAEFEMVLAAVAEEGSAPADHPLWRGAPVALRQRWAEFWGTTASAEAVGAAEVSSAACGVAGNKPAVSNTITQVGGVDDAGIKGGRALATTSSV
jgi:hypothetical protein